MHHRSPPHLSLPYVPLPRRLLSPCLVMLLPMDLLSSRIDSILDQRYRIGRAVRRTRAVRRRVRRVGVLDVSACRTACRTHRASDARYACPRSGSSLAIDRRFFHPPATARGDCLAGEATARFAAQRDAPQPFLGQEGFEYTLRVYRFFFSRRHPKKAAPCKTDALAKPRTFLLNTVQPVPFCQSCPLV